MKKEYITLTDDQFAEAVSILRKAEYEKIRYQHEDFYLGYGLDDEYDICFRGSVRYYDEYDESCDYATEIDREADLEVTLFDDDGQEHHLDPDREEELRIELYDCPR